MLTLKDWFLIAGVGLCSLGFMCFPVGYGANPKRDASLFNNFADAGSFLQTGGILFAAGVLVITVTLLICSIVSVVRRVAQPHRRTKS